jgi:hypothetical protein
MRRHIIITIILLVAAVSITVVYFKNLNTPGIRAARIMETIPGDAALIFEFNNDQTFYDIFNDNPLFKALAGKQKIVELDILRTQLLQNPILTKYFTAQNIFISLHPSKTHTFELLVTLSPATGFEPAVFEQVAKQAGAGMVITPIKASGKQGYSVYLTALKKRFFVINNDNNIFSGSFSKELAEQYSTNKGKRNRSAFVLLSEQQNANSLSNLYLNYGQLSPLFDLLFKNKSADILKGLTLLPGLATLSQNFRSDALMFNGITYIQSNQPASYLNLFTFQKPLINRLKDVFPATTAYSINFAAADPAKYGAALSQWHVKAGLKNEKDALFNKVYAETGINLKTEFNDLLSNEFAILTTRYFENFAIISIKDGSKTKRLMSAISKMSGETTMMPTANKHLNNAATGLLAADNLGGNSGQLNYDKLPFFLLGDAFNAFRHPYYLVIDNYLIFANSRTELNSYYDSYINRKFLSKNEQYNAFDNLLAEQSNVTYFFHFKNLLPILKRDLDPEIYDTFENSGAGWGNFYGASWQFTAAERNFYTNFCMKLNTATAIIKN